MSKEEFIGRPIAQKIREDEKRDKMSAMSPESRQEIRDRVMSKITTGDSRFEDMSDKELQDLWGKADDTAGDSVEGFAKGEISAEITRRSK